MEDLFVHCKVWEHEEILFTRGVLTSSDYSTLQTERQQQLEILVRKAIQKGEIASLEEFKRDYDVYIPSTPVRPTLSQRDIARITGTYITALDSVVVLSRVDEILPLLEDAAQSLRTVSAECAQPFDKWIQTLSRKRGSDPYPKEDMKFDLERTWALLHAALA